MVLNWLALAISELVCVAFIGTFMQFLTFFQFAVDPVQRQSNKKVLKLKQRT